MYASQWFLTIFTAKFPLNVTYQILDMYLCEVGQLHMCSGNCLIAHVYICRVWQLCSELRWLY